MSLMVFDLAYHDSAGGCTHDVVRMDVNAPTVEPHDAICLLCDLPVALIDRADFDAMYERKGGLHEYHRTWSPECPTCGAPMTVWSSAKGYALVCAARDEDDCPAIQWSDTVIGLHTLHTEAIKEATR